MFEDKEFEVPYDRLREAGHETTIVGLERGKGLTALQIPGAPVIGELVPAGEHPIVVR